MNKKTIEKTFNAVTNSAQIQEAVLFIESTNDYFTESIGYGGRDINSPMIMASITKLFTTACILNFCDRNRLSLEDKINRYLDKKLLSGLHVFKGDEYSQELTISDLLFQTSGLPDSFESGNQSSSNMMKAILEGDTELTFEQSLAEIKRLTPRFAPNTGIKAYYANMNFDLLGEILEKVAELSVADIFKQFIFEPLGLTKTYLPVGENDFVPHIFYKSQRLERPKLIASCCASGGCVTTAKDLMTFSKGFWAGLLFEKKVFERLAIYRKIQANKGPIWYGGGYMRIPLGGLMTMFMGKGELVGHSGSTGSFAFYYPLKELHIVGDLNQFSNPALPIRLLLKLAMFAV
jgi:CubicO group peptidase (beta-lactamase class C family)